MSTAGNYTIVRFRDVPCEALLEKSCGQSLAAALIFSADSCRLARIEGSEFLVPANDTEVTASLASAYEIRAFGPQAELRWTRDGATGTATLLADGTIDTADGAEITKGEALDRLERTYRVWGEPTPGAERPNGWSALSSGRIGTLFVPCSEPGELVLTAYEYVGVGKSGNAVVLFERLAGFASAAGDSEK